MGNPIIFARAVLMVRGSAGVELAVQFYNKALGLNVIRRTEDWAELSCGGNFRFSVKSVDGNEANLCTGYSPILSFTVSDMDSRIANCIQMGAHLDGPIQYPAHGKVATIRSPDGHMIGLYEPAGTAD